MKKLICRLKLISLHLMEGVSTTFPQTEAILENGEVNGVKATDVQKILNLKHAWEFIVSEFKSLLVAYYEGRNEDEIKAFLKEKCWRK